MLLFPLIQTLSPNGGEGKDGVFLLLRLLTLMR
jgi:hypothetical protein